MRNGVVVLGCLVTLAMGETKPPQLPVSTWVREDLFAGYMTNDMARFENGVKKVDDLIAADPKLADAWAWRAGGTLFLAVRAHEAGNSDQFKELYAKSRDQFAHALEVAADTPAVGAVYAIMGGSFTVFADRLPENLRTEGWQTSEKYYLALKEAQKDFFNNLPLHMRGEVLSGLAQAAQRLGEQEEAKARLAELIEALPDSPYATRARRWQEKPEVAATTSLTCQTCHDAGRLEAVMSRAAKRNP